MVALLDTSATSMVSDCSSFARNSRSAGRWVGDCFVLRTGMFGWREYAVMRGKSLTKLELPRGVPTSAALGILGGTGMTAYFGLLDVGKPMPGDIVVVSAAAGATGSAVAQIAKNVLGCYTIGIAGGAEKCAYLTEGLKLDASVEYELHRDFEPLPPGFLVCSL
jgi:NADPH-dependent curcumin reductase CurA